MRRVRRFVVAAAVIGMVLAVRLVTAQQPVFAPASITSPSMSLSPTSTNTQSKA